jgi:hypothetical protein
VEGERDGLLGRVIRVVQNTAVKLLKAPLRELLFVIPKHIYIYSLHIVHYLHCLVFKTSNIINRFIVLFPPTLDVTELQMMSEHAPRCRGGGGGGGGQN